MKRWVRITLRILIVFAGCIAVCWISLAWYIQAHKREILQRITTELSGQMRGTLTIRDISPSLWKSFPNISVTLKDVWLQDSLWANHHHRLLEVKDLYVKVNSIKLLSHVTEVQKITAAHGTIYMYTDSTGYANSYLLTRRDTARKGSALLDHFGLEDIEFFFVSSLKQKYFHLHINSLDGASEEQGNMVQMRLRADAHVDQMCFNTDRGSYIRNRDLDLDMRFSYDKLKKELHIPDQRLKISGEGLRFGGTFYFGQEPASFSIRFHTPSIPYATAVSWLAQNISSKIGKYNLKKPLSVDASVSGSMQYRTIPLVKVVYEVKDNELETPMGNIRGLSFGGSYFNEAVPGRGHGDDNSRIMLTATDGTWMNIPFHSDTLSITNLLVPYINARMRSKCNLTVLNDIVGGNVFSFNGGTAEADLHLLGGILPDDPTPCRINGFVKVGGAGLTYFPRDLSFTGVAATLLFQEDNLLLRNVVLHSKGSSLMMEGEAMHFLSLYFSDPNKLLINWRIRSPLINLNEFLTFIGKRRTVAAKPKAKGGTPISRIGAQLDKVLAEGSFHLDGNIDRVIYRNFVASRIIARATLAQTGITIEQAALQHAGGRLTISGVIHQQDRNNPFEARVVMSQVDVADVFKSFDNFGQDAIAANNLRGKLDATAEVSGGMTEGGHIIRNSINGYVDFRLSDGELNNFAPFEKVTRFAFKKRNLDHLTFKDIHNRLDVKGSRITINPMSIESSAINMNVQGVYSLAKGTDIFMEVPLRNPSKEEARTPFGKLLRKGKGIVIYLRAQDGDASGVKISWDPHQHGRAATADSVRAE